MNEDLILLIMTALVVIMFLATVWIMTTKHKAQKVVIGNEKISPSQHIVLKTYETKQEVEEEIRMLLRAQPDAKILSVFKDYGRYCVVELREYKGFKD